MVDASELLEHRIPDVLSTVDLPVRLAAEIDFLAGRVDRWCDMSEHATPAISARSLAVLGRNVEARRALDEFDAAVEDLADVAAASWAASRVGGPMIASLLARLDGEDADFLVGEVPVGPRRMFTGMLHAADGNLSKAVDELTSAVVVGDRRAPLWGALSRLELGRVLRTAEALPEPGVRPAAPVLAAARTFFLAGGYRSLSQHVEAATGPVGAVLELGRPSRVGFGVQPASEIRSSKGLIAIAHLVENGDRVVSAAELARVVDGRDASEIAAMTARAGDLFEHSEDQRSAEVSATIRTVLFDDAIRSRITKLLRRTIASLSSSDRLAAAHLAASVVTGYGCRYRPTGAPVSWRIDRRD
jgi:hypothetical protein